MTFLFRLFLILCLLLVARSARADEAAARQHFRQGVDLYDKKKYDEALEAFRAAYREKPSAGIKQNIALCLKAQGKTVEAATAFDEALDEGQGQLKPEVKSAIERELAELSKSIATITFKVVDETGRPLDDVTLTVEPTDSNAGPKRTLPPGGHRRPVRVAQGLWRFTAQAPNHAVGEKKLALVAGQPVDATFVLVGQTGATGTLTIRASVPDAVIRLDGAEVGKGEWSGKVPAGNHKIEVSADGYRTATIDGVAVTMNAIVDQPVQMTKIGEAPAPYDAPDRKPPRVKKFYAVPMAALDSMVYHFSGVLDAPAEETRKAGVGISVGARGGYFFTRMLAGELFVQAGGGTVKYQLRPQDVQESEVMFGHWQVTPMLRFVSPGKLRFTMGSGFGIYGTSLNGKIVQESAQLTNKVDKKGSGVAASWLIDAGLQVEAGPIFIEAALFLDIHGIGTVRDSVEDRRMLQSSPGARGGLRLGLGIPF